MLCLKRKKIINNIIKYLGLFLLISGLLIFIYYYTNIKKLEVQENLKIESFFEEKSTDDNKKNTTENSLKKNLTSNKFDYNYIAVLEIPSISLKKGLLSQDSYYNDVSYNIQIIEHSNMPDIINSNLILASHNGASYVSFFKNLYKLNVNDKIYIYYQGYKYEYSLDNIYDTPKDGKIKINRDYNKTTITLITCKKNSKNTQVVYIGYLTNREQYNE